MPRYVKNDRVIFASEKAYSVIYEAQGFLPVEDEKTPQDEENKDLGVLEDKGEEEDLDDYSSDDTGEDKKGKDLDPNSGVPLSAQVGLLNYEELKAKAKELGIPKYANTKQEELRELVLQAIEAKHDK